MNHKTLTIAVLIFSLLLTALMLRRGDLAWLALPFLVYLAAGIFLSPARESIHLQAERVVNRTSAGELALVEVRVTVRNLGVNLDRVDLSDLLPEGVRASQGQVNKRTALRSGEEAQLTYSFREKRGSYTWKNVRAVVSDPFGLVETAYLLPARGEIQVQPERDALRRLPLRPRSTLHSPGSIPARLGGSGTDFWGVREYQPGDPLRWLDWRLTARHPHKFFSKEFEQEEIADIGLILDAREKTDLRLEDAARQEVRATGSRGASHRCGASGRCGATRCCGARCGQPVRTLGERYRRAGRGLFAPGAPGEPDDVRRRDRDGVPRLRQSAAKQNHALPGARADRDKQPGGRD